MKAAKKVTWIPDASVCECGHLLQTHRGPCSACGCLVFVSEERPEQLTLDEARAVARENGWNEAATISAAASGHIRWWNSPVLGASRRVRNRGSR